MANIRPKIIEVVDVDMVTRVFFNVTSCRVLSTGSLVVKYLDKGIESTKVYKKASWRSYSRVWENTYIGGYLASHPLKKDFMNEPVFEVTEVDDSSDDKPIEYGQIFEEPAICYKCRNWDLIDARNMEGICRRYNIESYAEDGCQNIELKEEY